MAGVPNSIVSLVSDLLYRIYFQDKTGMVYQIPVNPESFRTEVVANIDNYNIVGVGDIIRPRTRQLKKWSWDGVFMLDITDPLNSYGLILLPQIYVTMIEKWMKEKQVIKFMQNSVNLAASLLNGSNNRVVIDKFEYEDRGGEPGDIYYSISLTEFREYGVSIISTEGIGEVQEVAQQASASTFSSRAAAISTIAPDIVITSLKESTPIQKSSRLSDNVGIGSQINFSGDVYKLVFDIDTKEQKLEYYKSLINQNAKVEGIRDNYYNIQLSDTHENVFISQKEKTIKKVG